jgi:glutaredoxin 3
MPRSDQARTDGIQTVGWSLPTAIQIYTTQWCGRSERAKALLDAHGIAYEEIRLDEDPAFRQTLYDAIGRSTVPQVVSEGFPIADYDDLCRLELQGDLVESLAKVRNDGSDSRQSRPLVIRSWWRTCLRLAALANLALGVEELARGRNMRWLGGILVGLVPLLLPCVTLSHRTSERWRDRMPPGTAGPHKEGAAVRS